MEVKASYINQYFDQVYILNLEKRPDRKVAMLQKLTRLGISAEFVQAVNGYSYQNKLEYQTYQEQPIGIKGSHPLEINQQRKLITSAGAWGYLKTYLGILENAKKRGFERILCFDDDVLFHTEFENQFKKATQTIPEDWKLLYLGASQYVWKIPEGLSYSNADKKDLDSNEAFYLPNNTDGSFAMGIHTSVFELLIHDILKMNCPFDSGPLRSVIEAYPENCFVLQPNIVIADVSESDIREGQDQKQLADQLKWNMADYRFPYTQDLVSVIMPAYNAEKTIEKSIRSILLQSYQSLELIIIDDASSDNTSKIVEQITKENPRVKLISLNINSGVGVARNEGIKASIGNIIAFQDADDISLRGRIAHQLIPLYEKNMLFSMSRFYRSRCDIDELDIHDQESTMSLVKSRRIKNKKGIYDYEDRAEVGLVTGVYKRAVFENFGLYEDLRYGEDLELIERILFYKLSKVFNKKYNGHSLITEHESIPNTYVRIEKPMYISPSMNSNNLTIQYQKSTKDRIKSANTFREKHRTGGLEQFHKLTKGKEQSIASSAKFNTLKLDTFVFLPEVEHQMLLSQIKDAKEAKKMYPLVEDLQNSISWKITAPLRWIGSIMKRKA